MIGSLFYLTISGPYTLVGTLDLSLWYSKSSSFD